MMTRHQKKKRKEKSPLQWHYPVQDHTISLCLTIKAVPGRARIEAPQAWHTHMETTPNSMLGFIPEMSSPAASKGYCQRAFSCKCVFLKVYLYLCCAFAEREYKEWHLYESIRLTTQLLFAKFEMNAGCLNVSATFEAKGTFTAPKGKLTRLCQCVHQQSADSTISNPQPRANSNSCLAFVQNDDFCYPFCTEGFKLQCQRTQVCETALDAVEQRQLQEHSKN